MRKLFILFSIIPILAFAQEGRYGHTSAGAAGAGSTANVRANTGWTASGTLARDTLYTNYAIFGAKTFGVGGTTQAQNARAKFNVLGRAANDTLLVFSNDGGGVVGDSAWTLLPNGHWNFGTGTNTAMIDLPASPTNEILWALRAAGAPRILLGRDASSLYGTLSFDGTNTVLLNVNSAGDAYINSFGGFRVSSAGSQAIIAATTTKGKQGFLTINANGTADTTFIVRNDKNSTLDSTFMVFANGRILRRDTKPLPAGAWLATASNGAALSSSNYIPTYAFDTTTAETLTVDFALPPNFIQISSVEIEVISPNTDGDSVGYAIAWLGRAADEAFNVAFSSPLSGQIDLGTTANVRKILTISGTFSNLAASDRIIFKLWRDPSVDDDVAADVHFVEMRINGNGLLY